MITAQQLKQIVPKISTNSLTVFPPLLTSILPKYHIDTPARIQCFISQVAHESANFNATEEFASGAAYEGRKDLGNVNAGDGKRFKGRGLIQITGRLNYTAVSKAIYGDLTLLKYPELLKEPKNAVESACWYWKDRNLNAIADLPDTWTHTVQRKDGTVKIYTKYQWLTVLINGGLNGYDDRLAFYTKAKEVIA